MHGLEAFGGRNSLHPFNPLTTLKMDEVGGPLLENAIRPVPKAELPQFVTQIRRRSALQGNLRASHYAVNVFTAIGRRKQVLTAQELRETVGLPRRRKIELQLFGPDWVLDRLWAERDELLPRIAAAGYDLVMGPSYSLWTPRPRSEHLIAMKQSNRVFVELQELGAPAVPRITWAIEADVKRQARWVNSNPVNMVALDLGTFRSPADWALQLEGLEEIDALTDRRLHYWINGPSTATRWRQLFAVLGATRCTISNGRLIAAPGGGIGSFSVREALTHVAVANSVARREASREVLNRRLACTRGTRRVPVKFG